MFRKEIEEIKSRRCYRSVNDRGSAQGRTIVIKGKEMVNFASNDYLGLASDDGLISGISSQLKKYGFGAGSSRLLSGGTQAHEELERLIAELKKTPGALVFNSGYAANTGTIPALAGDGDAIFSDELNHASIIDGCRLSKAISHKYKHCDTDDLRARIRNSSARSKMVVTDSIFSMDGDIAPLDDIAAICSEEGAVLYVDDAHGTGVLGEGSGAMEHFGITPGNFIIQMGTLSKAIGSIGGFIAADNDVIDLLINKARPFMFSTALPAIAALYSQSAIKLMVSEKERVRKLWSNIERIHDRLDPIGINKGKGRTHIVPVIFSSVDDALGLNKRLLSEGIYAPAIRPPAVKEPRIRISVSAFHTSDDIERLSEVIEGYFDK